MARTGSPSLAEVARLSGVSPSTVSRVLNRHTENFSVKEETRKRILEAVDTLGYRANPITRSIRAKQTNLIAVLGMRDFGTAIRGGTEIAVNAFMQAVYAEGFELCTNIMSPKEPPFVLPPWRTDAALAVDVSDAKQVAWLEDGDTPYVVLNGPAGPTGSSVQADDTAGVHEAVLHLVVLGHKRIAFAMPDTFDWHESLLSRHQAYLASLHSFGLKPVNPEFKPGLSPLDVVRRTVMQGEATAILSYNHLMAVKLLRACSAMEIRVPRDVSLVCFNDLFPCEDLVPSLTAMALPSREMGIHAAEIVLRQIRADGPIEPELVRLPEALVIRESTAHPPGD
ncbi:LacI family DNA-binding transcriptional regulator [Phycisphaera mikurensis]|uniref:Putative LacI family transcriptional regulator n=1 Tax=Phycisphaera mikurensis (strain NBRC 102666 / KCTC 22515 / FYK2301M01) TaxID=1142394 RepID=I0IJ77_PHYMF|nr:LacI family DNA-binding transcriptional regulator [Phycisphaera mikurensis]MBB6443287.1 LacI family transcriptional regulator [Phycisphaera mikurensis]BAM05315.1 putative LacI family transcriptional regulator [Phycisphaera mikurensis NBRC 102666]